MFICFWTIADMPSWVVGSCRAAYPPLTRYIAPQQRIWVVYGRTGQATMAGEDVYLQSWLAFGDPVSKAKIRQGHRCHALRAGTHQLGQPAGLGKIELTRVAGCVAKLGDEQQPSCRERGRASIRTWWSPSPTLFCGSSAPIRSSVIRCSPTMALTAIVGCLLVLLIVWHRRPKQGG